MLRIRKGMWAWALILSLQIGCEESDNQHDRTDVQEKAFARKRLCAALGRARLAEDQKEEEDVPALLRPVLFTEWCYSPTRNTCIYFVEMHYLRAKPVEMHFEIIDLLTNRTVVATRDWSEYQEKKQTLFATCEQ